jgi:WD40 repeat protein
MPFASVNRCKKQLGIMQLELVLLVLILVSGCDVGAKPSTSQPSPNPSSVIRQLPESTYTAPIVTQASTQESQALAPAHTNTLEAASENMQTPSPAPTVAYLPDDSPISLSNVSNLREVTLIRFEPWEMVTALDWSPDGRYLAVAAGNAVFLYALAPNGNSFKRLDQINVGSLTPSLAFSPPGDLLAAGSMDGWLRVWSITGLVNAGSQELLALQLAVEAHKKGVNWVAFSPGAELLASAGNDAMVRLWDLQTGQPVRSIIGGTYVIPSVTFTQDGVYLAIANGPRVRFREVETGRMAVTLQADAGLYRLALSPDGATLAAGALDGSVWLWQSPTAPLDPNRETEPLTFFPDDGQTNSDAFMWALQYNMQGNLLAAASTDARIYFFDAIRGDLVHTLQGHSDAVSALRFNPQGTSFVSGGLDATVRLWKVAKDLP